MAERESATTKKVGLRDDWLNQVREEIIDPDLPIVDAHHHLWDYPHHRYMLEQILGDTGSGHNVVATVFVECEAMYRADGPVHMRPVGETEFVNGIAAQSASGQYGPTRVAAGIVAHADLMLGDAVAEVLQAHCAVAPQRMRGIRHASGWDEHEDVANSHSNPPKGMLSHEQFRRGFAQLARHNLSFDAWLFHRQIPELTDLARAFPDTTIVLDHFGGPLGKGPYQGKREEIFTQWRKDISELAKCPNVVAKLGGLAMAVNGYDWHKRDLPPSSQELADTYRVWYLHAIESFGPDRCLFESNFPVDRISCSYPVLWNAFKRMTEHFSKDERNAMFHGTAARVYRLDLPRVNAGKVDKAA